MTAIAADLESLWLGYNHRIAGYIAKRIMDRDVLDDLVSSVFMRACVAMHNGNSYTESASGWLFQIARSVMWDYLRAKRRATFVAFDECEERADPCPQPDEVVHEQMHSEYVRGVVARLPDRQAWSITMRLDGLENDEIALAWGCSETVVRQVNTRAYSKLRAKLREAA